MNTCEREDDGKVGPAEAEEQGRRKSKGGGRAREAEEESRVALFLLPFYYLCGRDVLVCGLRDCADYGIVRIKGLCGLRDFFIHLSAEQNDNGKWLLKMVI